MCVVSLHVSGISDYHHVEACLPIRRHAEKKEYWVATDRIMRTQCPIDSPEIPVDIDSKIFLYKLPKTMQVHLLWVVIEFAALPKDGWRTQMGQKLCKVLKSSRYIRYHWWHNDFWHHLVLKNEESLSSKADGERGKIPFIILLLFLLILLFLRQLPYTKREMALNGFLCLLAVLLLCFTPNWTSLDTENLYSMCDPVFVLVK